MSYFKKQGKIATWNKKEGDKLSPGDVLCEVETDKASVGFEIQDEGYLAKILVAAGGNEINVGEVRKLLKKTSNFQTKNHSKFSNFSL